MQGHDTFDKTFASKYNGSIQLVKKDGEYTVLVDGIVESGPEIEMLWDEAIYKLVQQESLENVLILGFGAGSVVPGLRRLYPNCKIFGVEIDPVIIKLAQKYFPHNLEQVTLENTDAGSCIHRLYKSLPKQNAKPLYDLIIVDCYIGDREQDNLKTINFLRRLKKIGRQVLYNQLFVMKSRDEMKKIMFLKDLDTHYTVRVLKLKYNMIIAF